MVDINRFNEAVVKSLVSSSWPGDQIIADFIKKKSLSHRDYYFTFDNLFFEIGCSFGIIESPKSSSGKYRAYILNGENNWKSLQFKSIDNASRWLGEYCLQFLRENKDKIRDLLEVDKAL